MTGRRPRPGAWLPLVAALTLLAAGPARADWGAVGSGPGQFLMASGIAIGPTGVVYVSDGDPRLSRVQTFTDEGAFTAAFGGRGVLSQPRGLATDQAGAVYVADTGANRIVKLDGDGRLIASWGTPGRGEGQFDRPVAVAVDSADRVYALDTAGSVQQFTSDGAFMARWALPAGSATAPADLAVAPNGDVLALDGGSGVTTVLDPGGRIVASFGRRGAGAGQNQDGSGIATDSLGGVFIADRGNRRVQELSADGAFIREIGASGQLSGPADVAVDDGGNLYVVDGAAGRVVTFDGFAEARPGSGVGVSSLSATPVSGQVLVRPVGGRRFVRAKGILPIAAGWTIDARRGAVTLKSATAGGASSLRLRAGMVTVRLRRQAEVELALTGSRVAGCRAKRRAAVVRRIAVAVSGGGYAIRGRDSVTRASRGTLTVQDSCRGTATIVAHGTATVTALRGGSTRRVTAGQRHLVVHR